MSKCIKGAAAAEKSDCKKLWDVQIYSKMFCVLVREVLAGCVIPSSASRGRQQHEKLPDLKHIQDETLQRGLK